MLFDTVRTSSAAAELPLNDYQPHRNTTPVALLVGRELCKQRAMVRHKASLLLLGAVAPFALCKNGNVSKSVQDANQQVGVSAWQSLVFAKAITMIPSMQIIRTVCATINNVSIS